MQLCLQHYLIFLPPLPSTKIEPQPAKEQLLVVIQTIMPESSLRLGDMRLVFCIAPFVVKSSQNYPHWLCPRTLPQCWRGVGACRRGICSEGKLQPTELGHQQRGWEHCPTALSTLRGRRGISPEAVFRNLFPLSMLPHGKLSIHVMLHGPESCCLQWGMQGWKGLPGLQPAMRDRHLITKTS